ncbi:MAG: hypothetical protein QM709_06945 [Spongiibacteraceae bacterium]
MKNTIRKLKVVLPAMFLVSSVGAQAALVDYGNYIADTASGLDWLKLTQTISRSYDDISSQLAVGGEFAGWQFATINQFESMVYGQGVIPDPACAISLNYCQPYKNTIAIDKIVNAIGDTIEIYNTSEQTSNAWGAAGFLGDLADGSGHYVGILAGFYSVAPYAYVKTQYREEVSAGYLGSYLVRPSEVPVPSAGYLFLTAIFGLLGKRCLFKS